MALAKENRATQSKPLSDEKKQNIEQDFSAVVNAMKKPGLPEDEVLKQAFELALEKFGDARRENRELYIRHSLQVAKILADCGHKKDMVASAILHHLIEDCGVTRSELEIEFGENIADTVDAVSFVNELLDSDDFFDVKLLTESAKVIKAVYIKCADCINNLSTISIPPEEQQKAKAYSIRIIPAAKTLRLHYFVDTLESLCLEIEDPQKFQDISDTYETILKENNYTLYGSDGLSGLTKEIPRMIRGDGDWGKYVAEVEFIERTVASINDDIADQLQNAPDVKRIFTKHTVPLFDVFFVVKDSYMQSPENLKEYPESLFFKFYDKLHASRYKFTITGIHQDEYETFYHMIDWFGNKYRLFIQSETENMIFRYGSLVSKEYNDLPAGVVNTGAQEETMIPVFKRDGSQVMIVNGATVLDFAFSTDSEIGIRAKYAFLNESKEQSPIDTILKSGDTVEVVSDYTPHATVRWFQYLHTREAIQKLSGWIEKHMDSAVPTMVIYDADGTGHEIDMAATVLDFAFVINKEIGFHVKNAYINESKTSAALDTILSDGDKVRFDLNDTETPVFSWFGIVKTRYAKEQLIAYFQNKYIS